MGQDEKDEQLERVKRLRELYDRKAGDFEKYFAILVGVSLFVLFILLVPYVVTQEQENNVKKELEPISKNLTSQQTKIALFKNVNSSLNTLQGKLNDFPGNIVGFIKNVASSDKIYVSPNATLPSKNISIAEGSDYDWRISQCREPAILENKSEFLKCNVNQKIIIEIRGLNDTLFTEIIKPLSTLDNKSRSSVGVEELVTDFLTLNPKLYLIIHENSSAWNTPVGDTNLHAALTRLTENFTGKYILRIGNYLDQLTPVLENLKGNVTVLQTELKKLNSQRDNITSRISQFESPIGKLAAGFDDVILVFPLVLVSGFLVCSSFLIQSFRFRRAYMKSYPDTVGIHGIVTPVPDHEKAVTAPLWLDNKMKDHLRFGRFLVLLIPLGIYVVSVLLINHSWNNPESSLGYDLHYRSIFGALYWIFGLLLFGYSYVRILIEARK